MIRVLLITHFLTNMIRCFKPKIIEEGVEFGHWIKGWKAQEEVVKKKNHEKDCISKKHFRVEEALPLSSEGTSHNREVRIVGASQRQSSYAEKELPITRSPQ